MSESLRLVFAGTPAFAVPALEALARSRHPVTGVLTRPDKPAGRGQRVSESAVKSAARALNIPLVQPERIPGPEALKPLDSPPPDVMIVVAYGLLLPKAILDWPRYGCINIHASLLPRWRGAAPIQRALLAGDAESGVSIIQLEPTLDTGPVYLRRNLSILAGETAAGLHDRLAALGAEAIVEVIEGIAAGTATASPQHGTPSYARRIEKSEARIDWSQSAEQIARQVRAFNPWPIAQTSWRGQTLRVWAAHVEPAAHGAPPGTVLPSATALVACGHGALALDVVQLPGRRPLAVREFLLAHDLRDSKLGE
ncbi:MAG TPA: methionyl-tRNA formyltransferase [Steroidobacteraceae bacterium]